MKKIINKIQITPYESKMFNMYFEGKSFAVFDIETTGLSPASSKVILTGLLTVKDDGEAQVLQYYADQSLDEEEIIRETINDLEKVDYIITYNGRHFDMPFMKKRTQKYGITFPDPYNLDLYLIINGYAPFKEALNSLKQKSIEVFMGLSDSRDDEISGKESVDLYHRYMVTKSFDLERKILLHNHDDLIQLYKILPIIEKLDFHKALFKRGFLTGKFHIDQIAMKGRQLHIKAKQRKNPIDYISFPTEERPYTLTMDSVSGDVELTIPCECQAGAIFFDAQAILGSTIEKIAHYPAITNGYLIASENNQINEMEVNGFIKAFFEEIDN